MAENKKRNVKRVKLKGDKKGSDFKKKKSEDDRKRETDRQTDREILRETEES